MKYRIFLSGSGIAREAEEILLSENCLLLTGDPNDTAEDIAQKLSKFKPHALIVRQGKISAQVMDAAPDLKIISKHGVGVDNIDIDAATKRDIPVMITPAANYESVAEHALALMFALSRRIPSEDSRIRSGQFDKKKYNGLELYKKTLGLIGFGRIGRRLAELVQPLQMRILIFDPFLKSENQFGQIENVDLNMLFKQSDFISLHCPITEETKGLINAGAFNKMKPGAFLINTARGPIVNEKDLVYALREKRIAGIALDTLETEPPNQNNPLLKMNNVIFSPHVAGMSDNSFRNMGYDAVSNVLDVLRGNRPAIDSLVNKSLLEN